MDLKALRYFIEVVRQKSFTRAAEILHVTQPTLSKMIRQLEDELHSALLIRGSRGVWPTDVGEIVYQRGCQIIEQVRSTQDQIAEIKGLTRGELKVGLTPMISSALFTDVLRQFRQRYPQIALTVVECGSKRMAQAITGGEIELGMLVEPIDQTQFESRRIFASEAALAVSPESAWARRDSISLGELRDENFLLPTDDFMLPDMFRASCRDAGFTPAEAGRSSQWDLLQTMVETGMGVAVVQREVFRLFDPRKVVPVRIDNPRVSVNLSLAWRRGGYPSFAARAWTEISVDLLSGIE